MARAGRHIAESRDSLWMIAFAPAVWMLHFLLSYATVAVWCARVAGRDGELGLARLLVAVYTVLGVAAIAITAWRGYRRHSYGTATVPHDFATDADRHRFMGFATLLLCGLSLVAILYVALVAAFIRTCI